MARIHAPTEDDYDGLIIPEWILDGLGEFQVKIWLNSELEVNPREFVSQLQWELFLEDVILGNIYSEADIALFDRHDLLLVLKNQQAINQLAQAKLHDCLTGSFFGWAEFKDWLKDMLS